MVQKNFQDPRFKPSKEQELFIKSFYHLSSILKQRRKKESILKQRRKKAG